MAWNKKATEFPIETPLLSDIMSEEYTRILLKEDELALEDAIDKSFIVEPQTNLPADVLIALKDEPDFAKLSAEDADAKIAQLLQAQFDREHELFMKQQEEEKRRKTEANVEEKVVAPPPDVQPGGEEPGAGEESDDDAEPGDYDEDPFPYLNKKLSPSKDWDRFDTNEKEYSSINRRRGYSEKEGELKTKHDADITGRRNACKVMNFPPEFSTGDAGAFDMKLSNTVFNQLRAHTKNAKTKLHKANDRRENVATTVIGLDEPTRLILYKMINNQILESIDGVISTGKEAVILHADTDPSNEERPLPREVAIKIFSTTLNEFKQRDRYIKDDFRFKDRFSKQNARTVIHLWAEKEMHNLRRLKKAGILCPEVILLKKHVLVMSFIGENSRPAPKLKDKVLSDAAWSVAYEEIVDIMHRMYADANLIHADLSEFNILYYGDRCWIIDVAQSVEPNHPGALEFLMRDCANVVTFFGKKGLPNLPSKEELFFSITGKDPLTRNANQLERIYVKGPPQHIVNHCEEVPERFKPLVYPFELAWEKVEAMKKAAQQNEDDFEEVEALRELKYQEI